MISKEKTHTDRLQEVVDGIRRFDNKETGVDYFAGWNNALDTVVLDMVEAGLLPIGYKYDTTGNFKDL